MKYSIIIPHLNEGYLLDIMIYSIFNNFKYENFEIIIVDDGSNNLADLEFIKNHPLKDKIKVLYEKNLGLANAKNLGAKNASGDFLIFLDSHMYFRDDFLSKLDKILKNNNEINALQPIVGSIKDKKLEGMIYKIKDFILNSTWDSPTNDEKLTETPNIAGGATIIKKKIFDKIGGFNENFIKWGAEDIEFSMRLWLSGYKCFFSKELFIAHYFKESFSNTQIKSEQVLNNKIMFAYTCFQNNIRLGKILNELLNYYGEIFYDIHSKVLNNNDFWNWLEKQKLNYKFDDNWYFDKFNNYYKDF